MGYANAGSCSLGKLEIASNAGSAGRGRTSRALNGISNAGSAFRGK
jgi:hypothetical protein